jgi:hypothetical protein
MSPAALDHLVKAVSGADMLVSIYRRDAIELRHMAARVDYLMSGSAAARELRKLALQSLDKARAVKRAAERWAK